MKYEIRNFSYFVFYQISYLLPHIFTGHDFESNTCNYQYVEFTPRATLQGAAHFALVFSFPPLSQCSVTHHTVSVPRGRRACSPAGRSSRHDADVCFGPVTQITPLASACSCYFLPASVRRIEEHVVARLAYDVKGHILGHFLHVGILVFRMMDIVKQLLVLKRPLLV